MGESPMVESTRFLGRGLRINSDRSVSEGFGSADERGMRRKRNRCKNRGTEYTYTQ